MTRKMSCDDTGDSGFKVCTKLCKKLTGNFWCSTKKKNLSFCQCLWCNFVILTSFFVSCCDFVINFGVILSFCHQMRCHFVIFWKKNFVRKFIVILLFCHFVWQKICHFAILSWKNSDILSFCNILFCHFVILSFFYFVILSFVILKFCHFCYVWKLIN